MRQIAESLGAEVIVVSRVLLGRGSQGRTVIYDGGIENGAQPLERSFGAAVLGSYLGKAKAGTLWLQSASGQVEDAHLRNFQSRRRLSELAIIPLGSDAEGADLLELHFRGRITPDVHAALNFVMPTLARTWMRRSVGLFSDAQLKHGGQDAPGAQPILSISNPRQLSRAEYRLCHLYASGLTNQAVMQEAEISSSTLRTHLRNIYAKTGTNCLSGLIYELLRSRPGQMISSLHREAG